MGKGFGRGASPNRLSSQAIEPLRVSPLPGFDPARVADKIRKDDPYLASYLLGWFGLADPEPWGAAMSFALEIAHGYGLIKGESDTTATPLGLAVADILKGEPA